MSSLVLFVLNVSKKNIWIRRVPPRKALQATQLGVTLGVLTALILVFAGSLGVSIWDQILLVLFFVLMLFTGGWSVFIVGLLIPVCELCQNTETLQSLGTAFLVAFFLGALFAHFYNDLVNLLRWLWDVLGLTPLRTVFIHVKNAKSPMQIIKSPDESEITSETYKKLPKNKKLYVYPLEEKEDKNSPSEDSETLEAVPSHPFTILFVANPVILNRNGGTSPDPIIKNRDLFLRAVDDALFSLERNHVVGHADIWPYIRVLTLFDGNLAKSTFQNKNHALVQSFGDTMVIDGEIAPHLLYPAQPFMENLAQVVQSTESAPTWKQVKHDVDIIFALSASEENTRSMAYFSVYDPNQSDGLPFRFQHHGSSSPKTSAYIVPTDTTFRHEFRAGTPGLVALNVLGARNKTYIHEFAHALSSTENGAIVDEYFDDVQIIDGASAQGTHPTPPATFTFHVNRHEKPKRPKARYTPTLFATYEGFEYRSDLYHPSEEANWTGYFPEREMGSDSCIMDRTRGRYKFDTLLARFMYDRLHTKIHRS